MGRLKSAHIVAYEAYVGPVEPGMQLHHKCEVPQCVNPDHLMPMRQGFHLREHTTYKTHCKHGHSLEDAYVYVKYNTIQRVCRECILKS